jgi:hypothetical protein
MSYTKATLGDLAAAESTATDTGAAATESGQRAGDLSAEMERGVDDVAASLRTHFESLVTRMQGQADTAMSTLGAADWEGKSREMARDAESSLKGRLEVVMTSAMAGTDEFRLSLTNDAQAFVEGVRGQFATVMNNVDVAFQDLAAAEAAFAENLRDADETIQLG